MQAAQLDQLNHFVQQQQWPQALAIYQDWLAREAPGADAMPNSQRQHHLRNVDQLQKHVFYQQLLSLAGTNPRLQQTLDRFCGLKSLAPENGGQKPSFLYMPLGQQPGWFDVDTLLRSSASADQVAEQLTPLARAVPAEAESFERYLDHFDGVPEVEDWQALRQNWSSLHLVKSGAVQREDAPCQALWAALSEHFDLADCPPHAPEVFYSRLSGGGYIPPHHGLSNIKLTVHLPVVLHDESCWLQVAGEKRHWHAGQFLAFDDSFEHEASNPGEQERVVLIFDVWHPAIETDEKPFLRELCARFQTLSDEMQQAQRLLA